MTELHKKAATPSRRSTSFFGPFLLIAIGVYFLLRNLGWLPEALHWGALVQLWPLLLIFAGVNVIVQQLPRPLGSFLSGVVGLMTVAVFGYVLLFGGTDSRLAQFGVTVGEGGWKQEQVVFPKMGVETAVIDLNLDDPYTQVSALDDSPNLIDADVSYLGELHFGTENVDGEADIVLRTRSGPTDWFNPVNWGDAAPEWVVGLAPEIPLDLTVNMDNGAAELSLSKLTLSDLTLEGDNGSLTVMLPGGVYDVDVEGDNGRIELHVPENGRQTIDIEGDNGSITIYIPPMVEARVEFEKGNGSLQVDERFELIQSKKDDEVWQTDGYGDAPDRVDLIIDGDNGSINIRQP